MGIRCLVTGATGYIGGRLAPRLIEEGHSVRCVTRDSLKLRDVPWVAKAEVVEADLTQPRDLEQALEGIDVAYYLVHSLGSPDFESTDRLSASNFAAAAARAKVKRIVYLGGPEPSSDTKGSASPHLRSRDEVGTILAASGVPTIILRAAVIIGSGSASFEMLRYLTERLPVMVTPSWVGNRIQPIAVRDVLYYLLAWATVPGGINRSFDIGGATVLSYADMMRRYARVAKLPPRVILPVKTLSPWLSSQWIGLVTPVPGRIAKPLVLSLTEEAVCREHDIQEYVPDPPGGLKGFDESVSLALSRIRTGGVETRWANARWTGAPADPLPTDPEWSGGTIYRDVRQREVAAEPRTLWEVVTGIGGETGWYSFPLAWAVRGWFDRIIGGVGLRRGRRDPEALLVGEALDFWRVEAIEPGHLLRLRAEMRLPGQAWLEMRVGDGPVGSHYEQRAIFVPRGLLGHAYWWAVFPFHAIVFGGMARNMAHAAERRSE
jgi:uncharacterized protein YbjT (DUF2867 family)